MGCAMVGFQAIIDFYGSYGFGFDLVCRETAGGFDHIHPCMETPIGILKEGISNINTRVEPPIGWFAYLVVNQKRSSSAA